MSLIKDVGGKLVQSFLSLDDLILGQGVIAEGASQLGLTGRTVAGSMVVGSNVAARTVHLGMQAGTKTAKATAEALEGFVPGAGFAKTMAARLDEEVTAAAERASELASHAVELAGGDLPRNPLTQEKWLGKSAPRGYSWGELAADTAIDSLARFATVPVSLGVESAMKLASTEPGRAAVGSALKGIARLLELMPGGSNSTELDTDELRESLMAVTTSSGDAAMSNALNLAEAGARLALGDTRKLREAIEQGIERARVLAGHAELDELLPAIPISSTLRARARLLVDHAPRKFLAALERGPNGEAPGAGGVLAAMIDDADNLRAFATEYPLILALLGTHAAGFLTAAMLDVDEIEAWIDDDGAGDTSRPWSATQFEVNLGSAPAGSFFEPTVHAAQDVAFVYASEVLGREKALARAERLYDKDVRERLESDISLDLDILRAQAGSERDKKIRDHIQATTVDGELIRQRDECERQLQSLDAFSRSLYEYQPKNVADRTEILRTFLSLASQDLALRGAEAARSGESGERSASRDAFDVWLDSAVA